jgi:hypothetical protein
MGSTLSVSDMTRGDRGGVASGLIGGRISTLHHHLEENVCLWHRSGHAGRRASRQLLTQSRYGGCLGSAHASHVFRQTYVVGQAGD